MGHGLRAVVVALMLAGCGASGGSESAPATTTVPEPTTTEAPTTTRPPTTTTTEPPTTTTTYDLAAEVEDDKRVIGRLVEDQRVTVADGVEVDTGIDSVDAVGWDGQAGLVSVSATSNYSGPEYRVDEAWAVYRTLAQFWAEVDHGWRTALFSPALAFTNGEQSYRCSAEFMIRLATAQADRPAWEAECAA